jgi:hypothetical protein
MPTKKFKKEDLQALLWEDYDDDFPLEIIENEMKDTTRWSIIFLLVFKDATDQKFYLTNYSRGATESQDEQPFEYEGDEISCDEVAPVETVTITYQKVK